MVKVSVVIPTYNRLDQLKQVIAALQQQNYPIDDFEVVIVSDGCTDGTEAYLAQYTKPLKLQVLTQQNQGPAASRNLGASRAQGDIILFIDDDVVPTPNLIREHLKVHQENGEDIIALGPMLSPPVAQLSPWSHWEQEMLMKQYSAMDDGKWEPSARQFYTGNSSLSRQHLIDSGGFDISFRRAEDVELAYRLELKGLRFIYNPEAIGYHYSIRSFESWSKTPYVYGKNDVTFHHQKGHDWILPTIYKEYQKRHRITRTVVRSCMDRPVLTKWLIRLLKFIALTSYQSFFKAASVAACSGIFNLRYYQGVSDGLGGRAVFFRELYRFRHPGNPGQWRKPGKNPKQAK